MEEKILAPGLYLVATPIGNLEDITMRALRVLRQAGKIACEDTRQTQKLLNHYDLHTPTVSYHLFNEGGRAEELVAELKAGGKIAIVSDAGTPGIADPGAQLVAAAIEAGVPVFPVPGANAAISGLIASGLPAESFCFHGFLAARQGQRLSQLEGLAAGPTHVFYETPHRVVEALADVVTVFGEQQWIVIGREITKLHEEFLRGSAGDLRAELAGRAQVRGEMVLMLVVAEKKAEKGSSILEAVRGVMAADGLSEMDALKRVAKQRGVGKSVAYRDLQREQARGVTGRKGVR